MDENPRLKSSKRFQAAPTVSRESGSTNPRPLTGISYRRAQELEGTDVGAAMDVHRAALDTLATQHGPQLTAQSLPMPADSLDPATQAAVTQVSK